MSFFGVISLTHTHFSTYANQFSSPCQCKFSIERKCLKTAVISDVPRGKKKAISCKDLHAHFHKPQQARCGTLCHLNTVK